MKGHSERLRQALEQRAALDDVHGLLDLMGVPLGDSSGLDSA